MIPNAMYNTNTAKDSLMRINIVYFVVSLKKGIPKTLFFKNTNIFR